MKYFLVFAISFSFTLLISGQSTSSREAELKAHENRVMGRDSVANRHDEVRRSQNIRSIETLENTDRSIERRRKKAKDSTPTKADIKAFDAIRSPNPEDIILYEDFLKDKNTGIFKLFPDLDCSKGRIIRVDGECENIVSRSFAYSFSRKDYLGTDLILKDGNLISDSFLSQSIIVPLGFRQIGYVSLNLPEAKFLTDFKPETTSKKAKEQLTQIAKTLSANGFRYGKVVKIYDYETYLIRLISYQISDDLYKLVREESHNAFMNGKFDNNYWDFSVKYGIHEKRRDKIIAFKIIRIDKDGSVTIVWKELADKKSLILEFGVGEQLSDLTEP